MRIVGNYGSSGKESQAGAAYMRSIQSGMKYTLQNPTEVIKKFNSFCRPGYF